MQSTNRKNFLHGLQGAALALPFLESYSAVKTQVTKRMAHFYVPIGVVRRGFFPGEQEQHLLDFGKGDNKNQLKEFTFKAGTQALKNLTPTLKPIEEMKHKMTLITGLNRVFQNGTDVHAQCASCYLTSAAPYTVKNSAWPLKRTLDHVVADQIGQDTPFPTLEFSCNPHKDMKESIYFDNISWYGTEHVAPSMRNPRQIYNRLFKPQGTQSLKDVTDLVLADARSLKQHLSSSDQHKFNEYFEGIRSIEKKIHLLESMSDYILKERPKEPTVTHLPRGKFIQVMGDLMVAALQTGLTNVTTFMIGPERWNTPYMFDSISNKPLSHHSMSHNQSKYGDTLQQVDTFHVEQFNYIAKKMDQIIEKDGSTLLDNTFFTYGSGLGDGSTHDYNNLPIVVAGGKSMGFKGGLHTQMEKDTPLANLWLSQAKRMGLQLDQFADSTGTLDGLFS